MNKAKEGKRTGEGGRFISSSPASTFSPRKAEEKGQQASEIATDRGKKL